MKAKQYIYTSWKNGDLADKGFMIYSKSEGITEKECSDIKFIMQYTPPHDLSPTPSNEQINKEFPYSFAFFRLSSGRLCVAQSTYLGKDYSGRYGNYIIHALVFESDELVTYPCELFGEDFIKLKLTEEELNVKPPVPALEELEIENYSNIVNDELIMEFIAEREYEFSYLLSAVLRANTEDIPLYINDTREHLVLWLAAVHRVLPLETAKKISFTTYAHEHKKFSTDSCKERGLKLSCIGVRPDVNYFNYSNGAKATNQIVLDFIGNYITDGIDIPGFVKELSSSYLTGMDEINAFADFLNLIEFYYFSYELEDAYKFFRLYVMNKLENKKDIEKIIAFGNRNCPEHINAEVGAKIADMICNDTVDDLKLCAKVFPYLYKYASFMKFTIYDSLYKSILYFANKNESSTEFFEILDEIKNKSTDEFKEFLKFFYSDDTLNNCRINVSLCKDASFPLFFAKFIIAYYNESCDVVNENIVLNFLGRNVMQLCKMERLDKSALELSYACKENTELLLLILSAFMQNFKTEEKQSFCEEFLAYLTSLGDEKKFKIEDSLMQDAVTVSICAHIYAQEIKKAKNPMLAFWNLYEGKFKISEYFENIDLSPMVSAALSKASSFKNTLKLICEIPVSSVKNEETSAVIASKLATEGMKTLLKIESDIIYKAFNLCKHSKSKDTQKLASVALFKQIQNKAKQNAVYPSFADIYADGFSGYDINSLENREYSLYISQAMPIFILCIYDNLDLETIVNFCADEEKLNILCENIASCMKKFKKKSYDKYEKFHNIVREYAEEEKESENKTKKFSKLMVNYLANL